MTPIILARVLLRRRWFRMLMVQLGPVAARQINMLVEKQRYRRSAVVHAEHMRQGQVSDEFIDGEIRWVVWRGDEPLAVYPPYDGDLRSALRDSDPARRRDPAELPTRRARDTAMRRLWRPSAPDRPPGASSDSS